RAGVVLTADCLPVFFADLAGPAVAVAHAGWRGLAAGVLENTVAKFQDPQAVAAWLGPAIGPCHFEVGAEVRAAFLDCADGHEGEAIARAFTATQQGGKWMADIYALARLRLQSAGISRISGGHFCTI